MEKKEIIKELREALRIANRLGPELREATFKRLVREYIQVELPALYENRKAG